MTPPTTIADLKHQLSAALDDCPLPTDDFVRAGQIANQAKHLRDSLSLGYADTVLLADAARRILWERRSYPDLVLDHLGHAIYHRITEGS